ncbi:MAG: transposase [candidate division NC10 bacterium RBG_16_65_8]|nr:MAG: transposase [candidate division NC10 bacterium RBG_16_65_8]
MPSPAAPRLREANRTQVCLRPVDLESLLPEDHRARIVWAYVEGLDLTLLYQNIAAVEGEAGRPATDPKILLALWLFATLEGVGAARALDRLCTTHVAYQWLCGGVPMNYHTLADFRTAHGAFLDTLLTQGVAALLAQGLVTLERVAQDGVRVRASAGAASFRRRKTLEVCLAEAEAQVQTLRVELEADPGATTTRQRAARERAARERQAQVARALAQLPALEAKKKPDERLKARASTTDPEARVMKMADGGYRPAYNLQFATDTGAQVIVGVDATNAGTDHGQLAPMVDQLEARHAEAPGAMLVDGGFATKEDIAAVSDRTTVYAPVQKPKDPTRDPHAPLPTDTPAVAAWRERMGTPEAQALYKERAATAECVNAQARNRGLRQLGVRGLPKVRVIALWYAVAHNLARAIALGAVAGFLHRG